MLLQDMMQEYMPGKFRKSERIVDLCSGYGRNFDLLKERIDSMSMLYDIDKATDDMLLLILLNDGLAASMLSIDSYTLKDIALTLLYWYGIKGTEEAFKALFYSKGFDVSVTGLWTMDYMTFYDPDIESVPVGAYVTPHFVLRVNLGTLFSGELLPALAFQSFANVFPEIIPAHNVLERIIFQSILNADSVMHPGSLTGATVWKTYAFLTGEYGVYTDVGRSTDEGYFTDVALDLTMLFSEFRYGIGHKTVPAEQGETDLENTVGVGAIYKREDKGDYFRVLAYIPSNVVIEEGVSEVGLFDASSVMQVIGSFPNIVKEAGYEVWFTFNIWKSEIILPS